jgi:hypothetical protein
LQRHKSSQSKKLSGNANVAMGDSAKSCRDDLSITKPSGMNLDQLADAVGGKASLSSYEHFDIMEAGHQPTE